MRNKKLTSLLPIILIVLLATFLRFYRIEQTVVFHGELGHNYLAIKNFVEQGQIPLLGPPTSHPWLFFGPLFYWLITPVLVVAEYNPISVTYFMAFIGSLIVLVNYIVIRKLIGEVAALISSYIIAISPAYILLTKNSRFYSLVPLFFYLYFYFLVRSLKDKGRFLFLVGLFLGLMMNFHLTPIILILPTLILLFIYRKDTFKKRYIEGTVGLVLPNLPFLIYSAQNKFNMLFRVVVWVPYRMLGFIGLYPKNTVSKSVFTANISSLYEFVTSSYIAVSGLITIIIFLLLIAWIIKRTLNENKQTKKNTIWVSLVTIFLVGYLGIFIHGDPPLHYYLPLYPLPIIFITLMLLAPHLKRYRNFLILAFLAGVTVVNLNFYFSDRWFFRTSKGLLTEAGVPYETQLLISDFIIKDANKNPYQLSRVGLGDNFEGDYAQNYQYLLWLKGNEPAKNSNVIYTIYEGENNKPGEGEIIYSIENIFVTREAMGN